MHRFSAASARRSFVAKLAVGTTLVGLADALFLGHPPGATLGMFALAWTAGFALVARPRPRSSWMAFAAATGFGAVLIDDPSLLGWTMFWVALASAALLPRHRFLDAAGWGLKLASHAAFGLIAPLRDARRFTAAGSRRRSGLASLASILALPIIGGGLFLALFASANPLIANAFAAIALPGFADVIGHLAFWSVVLVAVWPSLRPRALRIELRQADASIAAIMPTIPMATLALSLAVFNLVFGIENGLDLAFLWSGAALPGDVTLADYAHRGAYALIVTALLAGLFVLVALRPGSEAARRPLIRRLVILWVAQNLLLVASSGLRTLEYIDAYSMTVLRLAALAWIALVASGLVLICWRLLAARSARWLINANALAAALVLSGASIVDLGATAAAWNVRHARTAAQLDLCYLRQLGPSALLSLIALEHRVQGPALRDRVADVRAGALTDLEARQADWHRWTWRDARRLAAARVMLGSDALRPRPVPAGRGCNGTPIAPPAPDPARPGPAAPLTRGAEG